MNSILTPTATHQQAKYSKEDVLSNSLAYFNGDDLAASTFVSKYALRDPKIKDNPFCELTPRDMHTRLATEIALQDANLTFGGDLFNIEEVSHSSPEVVHQFKFTFEELFNAFDHFKYIVPQGSPMYGIGNPFVRVSISNCVVVESPMDTMSSIIDTGKELANLFKRRCGVGLDISTLRPAGSVVSNSAGTSTGAWSFADFYSHVCRTVGQNGRRGALMLTLDVRHPDIDKFIVMKQDLTKVTGANISIMLTDEFMESVGYGGEWICKYPIETRPELGLVECDLDDLLSKPGKWAPVYPDMNNPIRCMIWESEDPAEHRYAKKFVSQELWTLINECACRTAEPGLLFWDNYLNNLPAHCYGKFRTICVNPCSEIGLSAYDSCRLTSLNLKSFVLNPFTAKASFDFVKFERMVRLGMRVMDSVVELEIKYLENIVSAVDDLAEKEVFNKLITAAKLGRRTGLGCHGLADALCCLRLKYDSNEAIDMADRIFECLRDNAYDESVNLAIERGPFPEFDWQTEKDCAFIKRLPLWLQEKMSKHGRRHISLLTMAPTGSVSIESQTSSGVEPVFMFYYMRNKKVNPSDPDSQVDFVDAQGDRWEQFMVFHPTVLEYFGANSDRLDDWNTIQKEFPKSQWSEELSKILPDYFVQSSQIDGERRIEIQGAIQKYIDHGISSTINLPKGTTPQQVAHLYVNAWKYGLKGVTVYVDGSRSGVLVAATDKKEGELAIVDTAAPKRPEMLPCDIIHSTINGEKWTTFIGLLNGRPYEIFGGLSEHVELPRKHKTGHILKRKCEKANAKGRMSCYDLVIGEGDDRFIVKDIAIAFNDVELAWATRAISTMLRHGVPVSIAVDQLSKDMNSNFQSFSKVIARQLKKYVVDGTSSGESCPECGSKLIFQEGCHLCPQCGASKCS